MRSAVTRLTPVWPNLPDAATFTPVVALLVFLLPATICWLFGHLTPGQSTWGILAVDVLEGDPFLQKSELSAPWLFPWLEASMVALGVGDLSWRMTLVGLTSWLLAALVIDRVVRRWYDETTSLIALILLAVNPAVIGPIQDGHPAPVALLWTSLIIWAFTEHRRSVGSRRKSRWASVGGFSLGMLTLTVGLSAVWVAVLLAVYLLIDEMLKVRPPEEPWYTILWGPMFRAGLFSLSIAAALVVPWLLVAPSAVGAVAIFSTAGILHDRIGIEAPLIAMPTTMALGLFGVIRVLQYRLKPRADRTVMLPVLWLVVGYVMFLFVERNDLGLLNIVVPTTILAARTLLWVMARRFEDRISFALMLLTLVTFVFAAFPSAVASLFDSFRRVWHGGIQDAIRLDGWDLLGVHVAFDVALVGVGLLIWLYRASGQRDEDRRLLFGGYALFVLVAGILVGLPERLTLPRSTDPWGELHRQADQRTARDWVAVVGSPVEPPMLEFAVRSASMGQTIVHVRDLPELDAALDRHEGRPLVIISDPGLAVPDSIPLTQRNQPMTLGKRYQGESGSIYAQIE